MAKIKESINNKISKKDFLKLAPLEKIDCVQDLLLNSIYESITDNKIKLPDLVKAQTIFNRSILLRTKERDKETNKFIGTPSQQNQKNNESKNLVDDDL